MSDNSDIRENTIYDYDPRLLEILLIDRTLSNEKEVHNIIWATDNYVPLGEGYKESDEITVKKITGENGLILRPRVNKSKAEQEYRSRDKAEVFTANNMPRNKRSKSGVCQGPKYFSYNGTSLYKLKTMFSAGDDDEL